MEAYLSDNQGRRVPPDVLACNPVAASGITLTDAATGGDETQTVVGGATYAFTCNPAVANGNCIFSCTDTILTAANIEWVACVGETIIIQVPQAKTTLHWESLANGGGGWLRRIN